MLSCTLVQYSYHQLCHEILQNKQVAATSLFPCLKHFQVDHALNKNLKHVFAKVDYEAENYSLKYLRTKEGHEVDFVLVCNDCIEKMIEVKNRDDSISSGLRYFQEKYKLPAVQLVKELKRERVEKEVELVKGLNFLKTLLL